MIGSHFMFLVCIVNSHHPILCNKAAIVFGIKAAIILGNKAAIRSLTQPSSVA